MPRLSLSPIFDSYLLVAAVAAALVVLLALVRANAKRVGPGGRAVLAALRAGVLVLALILMLRPTLVYTTTAKQAATLIVLADRSRSMSVPDELNGRSRWEAQRLALDSARDALRRLDRQFQVKAYTFDSEAHRAEVVDGAIRLGGPPDGKQTALGAVLDDVLRPEAGSRLLGVILLGDGAQRALPPRDLAPQTAAAQMKNLDQKLYTVRFGKAQGLGQAQDVAVRDLVTSDRVFVKNELEVSSQIRVDGYVNRQLTARLLFETSPGKMTVVAERPIQVRESGQLIPVHFAYAPQTQGEHKLSVEVAVQPGELVVTNNRQSTFVHVLGGGLNVLYLEGALRPEEVFLKRSLDASPDIHVDFVRLNPDRPQDRPQDLAARLQPGKYDVYMLGDLDSTALEPGELEGLAEAVSRGAGLAMLGGFQSFGPGGYADTPLAAVLPVTMSKNERQRPQDPVRTDVHWPGPLRMRPTQAGLIHFILLLGATRQESLAAWDKLPPLDGANRFGGLKPGALVLAEAGPQQPLLVTQLYVDGRVAAFAGDSTWRWCMRGHQAEHKRFWRQLVLWLGQREKQAGEVWVKLAGRRFSPGQRVEFTVGAQSATGEALSNVAFDAQVILPDGSRRSVRLVKDQSRTFASFRETAAAGDYTVRVTARVPGQPDKTAEARFLVTQQDLELDNPAADATLLENLATMTGGKAVPPEELSALISHLNQGTAGLEVQTETKKTLWDTWTLFLLLVGLLGGEWYLRKRWGLV